MKNTNTPTVLFAARFPHLSDPRVVEAVNVVKVTPTYVYVPLYGGKTARLPRITDAKKGEPIARHPYGSRSYYFTEADAWRAHFAHLRKKIADDTKMLASQKKHLAAVTKALAKSVKQPPE